MDASKLRADGVVGVIAGAALVTAGVLVIKNGLLDIQAADAIEDKPKSYAETYGAQFDRIQEEMEDELYEESERLQREE